MGKTGTTTLQRFLRTNAATFAARGILIPATFGEGEHIGIVNYALDEQETDRPFRKKAKLLTPDDVHQYRAKIARRFDRESRGFHTAIISSERCWSALDALEDVERLRDFLRARFETIEVVVYLRPQHEFAVSLYTTLLKNGATTKTVLPPPETVAPMYRYDERLALWAGVFGREAIRVRRFGLADTCDDFMGVIGMSTEGFAPVDRSNASLSAAGQEFLRLFNQRVETNRGDIFGLLQRIAPGQGRLPSRTEAEAFYAYFAESNERTRRDWFPDLPSLFSPAFDKYPDVADPPALSADETLDITAAIWREKQTVIRDLKKPPA